jgi:DNA-binding NarL/FixJ family response regulator
MSAVTRPCGRIVIVDDDQLLRALLVELLQAEGYVTTETASGEAGLERVAAERPDLVVLDVQLPGISGYEVCRRLREEFGDAPRILFISGSRTEPFDRVAGLLLGGDDYLTKPFAPDEFLARVRTLIRRGAPPVPERLAGLTSREREVLDLLAHGRAQKEIAQELFISPKTVGTHIAHIFEKLGVHSRAQAVAIALGNGDRRAEKIAP